MALGPLVDRLRISGGNHFFLVNSRADRLSMIRVSNSEKLSQYWSLHRKTMMTSTLHNVIQERNLLKLVVQIHHWESLQQSEFQSWSGRDLYFRMAENLLNHHDKPQSLKFLNGSVSERAIRDKRKVFQKAGFLEVANAGFDLRTRQIMPTDKFIIQLNLHLKILRTMINQDFVLIDKS